MNIKDIIPGETQFRLNDDIPIGSPNQFTSDMTTGAVYLIRSISDTMIYWLDDVDDYRCYDFVKALPFITIPVSPQVPPQVGTRFKLNSITDIRPRYITCDMTVGRVYTVSNVTNSLVYWWDDVGELHSVTLWEFQTHYEIVPQVDESDVVTPPPEQPPLDLTRPLRTRSGNPFTLLSQEGKGDYPLIGQVNVDGEYVYASYTRNGEIIRGAADDPSNLENEPETLRVTQWAAYNIRSSGLVFVGMFNTETGAYAHAGYAKEVTFELQN